MRGRWRSRFHRRFKGCFGGYRTDYDGNAFPECGKNVTYEPGRYYFQLAIVRFSKPGTDLFTECENDLYPRNGNSRAKR